MSADFTPTMGTYIGLRPFRFWCQKVLPLVYDDSLSYYELLNKVVDYLNKCMEDIETLHEDVDDLHDAYVNLQNYVNNYFDNLDVQEEINNKLDEMAEDGSLSALIQPLFDEYKSEIDDEIDQQNSAIATQNQNIAVLSARMDTFASLPDGSTAGDAELEDIRIGANGVTYASAGNAVRAQVSLAMQIRNVTGITDLNNVTTVGFYVLGYSQEVSNCPIAKNSRRLIRVYPPSDNYIIQEATNVVTGANFWRNYSGGVWSAWVDHPNFSDYSAVNDGDNLNNYVSSGNYTIGYSANVTNDPVGVNHRRLLIVYSLGTASGQFRIQEMIDADSGKTYFRSQVSGTWYSWVTQDIDRYSLYNEYKSIPNGSDLNDYTDSGNYIPGYASSLSNDPIGANTRRLLHVYSQTGSGYTIQEILNFESGVIYYRYKTSGVWSAWGNGSLNTLKNNMSYELPDNSSTRVETIDGVVLKVGTYNVANYNNDSETYISNSKLFELRKILNDMNLDILGVEEDREYIDSSNTLPSASYIYNPILPNSVGAGAITIRSKKPRHLADLAYYTSGRMIRWATYTIGNKELLVVSTHCTANYNSTGYDSAETKAVREQEYTELFKWIHQEIELSSQTCPTWDWCIILGDMNSITDDDRDTLIDISHERGFSLANGEYLGWINTVYSGGGSIANSVDNIICSEDIVINKVTSYCEKYNDLYSDHVPLTAEVTLL